MSLAGVFKRIRFSAPWCPPDVFASTLRLALEIAREGQEGRRVGTVFTLGGADRVLASSRGLILDPLAGHAPRATHISSPSLRGTLKQLAQLDGAFVIDDAGAVVAASRYLDAPAKGVVMPLGLGSRHLAAAAASKHFGVIAIVVSESGTVRIFYGGDLLGELR
jgi:DNA integrity scanning protein DisA with diadenylate cyclase activity